MSESSNSNLIKLIEVGKFYLVHDGSRTGHPGYVISKDDEKNEYLVVITESDKSGNKSKRETDKRHLTDLSHPTDINVCKSYIKNRPMICKRKDLGCNELIGMHFHQDDIKKVEEVSRREPVLSPSRRKQKNNR